MCTRLGRLTDSAQDAAGGEGGASNRAGGRGAIKEYLELDTGIICARRIRCVDQGDKRNSGVAIRHQENIILGIPGCLIGAKVSTVYSRPDAAIDSGA